MQQHWNFIIIYWNVKYFNLHHIAYFVIPTFPKWIGICMGIMASKKSQYLVKIHIFNINKCFFCKLLHKLAKNKSPSMQTRSNISVWNEWYGFKDQYLNKLTRYMDQHGIIQFPLLCFTCLLFGLWHTPFNNTLLLWKMPQWQKQPHVTTQTSS